jgi:uncharacterized membrane protein
MVCLSRNHGILQPIAVSLLACSKERYAKVTTSDTHHVRAVKQSALSNIHQSLLALFMMLFAAPQPRTVVSLASRSDWFRKLEALRQARKVETVGVQEAPEEVLLLDS